MEILADRIKISDLRVESHIGVTPEERAVAQSLSVTIELFLDLGPASSSDDLDDSVDYGTVALSAAKQLRANSRQLLEAAAGDLLETLMELPRVSGVAVELAKLDPPIPERVGPASVRLERVAGGPIAEES